MSVLLQKVIIVTMTRSRLDSKKNRFTQLIKSFTSVLSPLL